MEGIFFHPPFIFSETSWYSALLDMIILLHVSNWIAIWCYFSLVCSELGLVNSDGCVCGFGYWVTLFSNFSVRLFLSSRAMVLRLEPSMIAFRSIFFTSPCSENTFSQYRIWAPKDDRRAIAWV